MSNFLGPHKHDSRNNFTLKDNLRLKLVGNNQNVSNYVVIEKYHSSLLYICTKAIKQGPIKRKTEINYQIECVFTADIIEFHGQFPDIVCSIIIENKHRRQGFLQQG